MLRVFCDIAHASEILFCVHRTRVDALQLGWCHVRERFSRQDGSVLGPSNSWLREYGDSGNCARQSGGFQPRTEMFVQCEIIHYSEQRIMLQHFLNFKYSLTELVFLVTNLNEAHCSSIIISGT